jgi:hypothetical protein
VRIRLAPTDWKLTKPDDPAIAVIAWIAVPILAVLTGALLLFTALEIMHDVQTPAVTSQLAAPAQISSAVAG